MDSRRMQLPQTFSSLDTDKDMKQGLTRFRGKPYWLPSLLWPHLVATSCAVSSNLIKPPQAEKDDVGVRQE